MPPRVTPPSAERLKQGVLQTPTTYDPPPLVVVGGVRERPWTLKTGGGITDENLSEGMAIGEEFSPSARREFTASINSCCEYSQDL